MKQSITIQILNGALTMPNIPQLRAQTSTATYSEIERMFVAMWNAYLRKGAGTSVSLPYWAKRINNPKAMNIAISTLSKAGWIFTKALPNNNWAEAYLCESKLLNYVSADQLSAVRTYRKFARYQLKSEALSTAADLTKVRGEIKRTGIVANGFTKEGNIPFSFDVITLSQWKDEAITLVNKGIAKTIEQYPELVNDEANYRDIATAVVENYILEDGTYTSGARTSDPRGRNNAGYLNKIGNPVGFKIMRSLLVIPEQFRRKATTEGLNNIYLFVAELNGFKNGTVSDKIAFGQACYDKSIYLGLDTDNADDLDKLYENVWLERIYDELNGYYRTPDNYYWSVPIEIDMSALT